MTDQPEEVESVDEAPADPIRLLQDALGLIYPEAMCTSFAVVAEWLEPDGAGSFQVFHSQMPPWAIKGLLTHALDHVTSYYAAPQILDFEELEYDGDDDDF